MSDKKSGPEKYKGRSVMQSSSPNGIWFLGFIGALAYYLHNDSGTFWLVVLAFLKAIVWPVFVVFHLLSL